MSKGRGLRVLNAFQFPQLKHGDTIVSICIMIEELLLVTAPGMWKVLSLIYIIALL